MISILANPWFRIAAFVIAFATALAWLRWDAARDARNQVAVEASQKQEEVRHEAEEAARDAERDGARERLRSGTF